jgi:flagellar protein FlbD
MLELTRLNGSVYFINPDLIYTIEATPDTVLRLTNGEHLVIKESIPEFIERFEAYKKRVYSLNVTVTEASPV